MIFCAKLNEEGMILENVNYRIRVDWDGDNVFATKPKTTTPLNLVPAARGQSLTGLRGIPFDGSTLNPEFIDYTDNDENGLSKRRIQINTSHAKWAEAGMLNWIKGQTRPGDVANIITDASSMNYLKTATSARTDIVDIYQPSDFNYGYNVLRLRGRLLHTGLSFNTNFSLGSATAGWTNSSTFSDAAISTPTFILSPSTTYKIGLWSKTRKVTSSNPQDGVITLWIWYANGTTTPTRIAATLDTNGLATRNGWTLSTWHFTTPAVVTNYGITAQLTPGTGSDTRYSDWEVGGLTIYPNSAVAADFDRFRDDSNPFRAEQFNVILEANKAYRGAFYVRKETTTNTILLSTWDCELDTINRTQDLNQQSNAITTNWSRIEFSIPSRSYNRGLLLRIEISGAVGATLNEIDFKGFMIWEGTEVGIPFNTGVVNGYDDITDFVLSTNWKTGKKGFTESLPFEGTLEVELDNDSKLFSPNNVNSPLYGNMRQGRLIQLQIQNGITSSYETLWTGQITKIELTAGRTSDRCATITAEQGINALEESEAVITPVENTRIGVVVDTLIEESSWRSSSPYQAFTDAGYRVDDNAFVKDSDLFDYKDEGVYTLDLIGQDWSRSTSVKSALQSLMESESAQLWATPENHIVFTQRDYWTWKLYEPIETLVLDTLVQKADYAYGEDIINSAEVKIQPKKINTTGTLIWSTKRAIRILPKSKRTIPIQADVGSGLRPAVIIEALKKDLVTHVSLYDIDKVPDAPELTDYQRRYISIDIVRDGRGRYAIELVSRAAFISYAQIEVHGKVQELGDEVTGKAENTEAIEITLATHKHSLNSKILNSIEQAESTASAMILRNAQPDGEFTSLDLVVDSVADVVRVINYQVGEILNLTETQTGETVRPHVILGISGSIDAGGILRISYDLARLESTEYAVTDVSILGAEELNMIDHKEIIPTNGGIVKEINLGNNVIINSLNFGRGGSTFFFGLDTRSVVHLEYNYNISGWPENSAVGVSLGLLIALDYNIAQNNNGEKTFNFTWTDTSTIRDINWGHNAYIKDYVITDTAAPPAGSPTVPVEPGKKYRLYITKNSAGTMLITTAYTHLTNPGNAGEPDTWNDSLGAATHTLADEGDSWRNLLENEIRAKSTSKIYGNGISIVGVGSPSLSAASSVYFADFVRFDGRWGTYLETGAEHYFTLWASVGAGMRTGVDYIIDVYGNDGLTKVTDTVTMDRDIQKFELLIPDTEPVCFVNIRRADTDADGFAGDSVWVYGYAITKGQAPDDYNDVNVPGTEIAVAYA